MEGKVTERMKNYVNIEGIVATEPDILINKYGTFVNFIIDHSQRENFTISCSYLLGEGEKVEFKKGDFVEITGKLNVKRKDIPGEKCKHFIQIKVRTIKKI